MTANKTATPATAFYRPGQALFKEGENPRSIFLIKKGTVAIRKMKGPDQIELARIYSNEVLGELSFFDHSPRSASAIALTEVEVLEIPFESLEKIYESVPPYLKTIVAAMAERLRRSGDTIRRLQKDVIQDVETVIGGDDGPSASEVLAATLQVDDAAGGEPADGAGEPDKA
jgi:CRP-like cAMP-binding protein